MPLNRNIIWLADTNYRIDLENEVARSLAQASSFDALFAADQVGHRFEYAFSLASNPLVAQAGYWLWRGIFGVRRGSSTL